MKYCTKCGKEIAEEAVICPGCGCPVASTAVLGSDNGLSTAAKVFMILSCVGVGCFILPLAWLIPMTVHYFNCIKQGRPVSTGFKVCTLLFCNLISGILMLCDNEH